MRVFRDIGVGPQNLWHPVAALLGPVVYCAFFMTSELDGTRLGLALKFAFVLMYVLPYTCALWVLIFLLDAALASWRWLLVLATPVVLFGGVYGLFVAGGFRPGDSREIAELYARAGTAHVLLVASVLYLRDLWLRMRPST